MTDKKGFSKEKLEEEQRKVVYPFNHAIIFDEQNMKESEVEYIAEIYGSPEMMFGAAYENAPQDPPIAAVYASPEIMEHKKKKNIISKLFRRKK